MRITILGAGAFGSALKDVLIENHHEVKFYDPLKFPDTSLKEATANAEAIICTVPSDFAVNALAQIPDKNIPLINASKGFLSLQPFKKFPNFSIISGGTFASQLADKQPTILTVTSDLAENLFKTSWLQTERTQDYLGVTLCGTLKNIYAIGSGEKALQPNTKAFREYIEQALKEIKFILSVNNADPATANLSCGKLDLIMTCATKESRNYQFGDLIRRRNHLDPSAITDTTEGFSAIQKLPKSNLEIPTGCPLINHIIERVTDATK